MNWSHQSYVAPREAAYVSVTESDALRPVRYFREINAKNVPFSEGIELQLLENLRGAFRSPFLMGDLLGDLKMGSLQTCLYIIDNKVVMVGERGFEPPTPWSRTRCSTRLSHSPNMRCGCVSPGAAWCIIPFDALGSV